MLRSAVRWLALLPMELFGIWVIWKLRGTLAVRSRLTRVFLAGAFYYTTLVTFWPLRERQTYLPLFPVMAIAIVPCILCFAAFVSKRLPRAAG